MPVSKKNNGRGKNNKTKDKGTYNVFKEVVI